MEQSKKMGAMTTSVDLLSGGGEMGALMRALDWWRAPRGPIEAWPQGLRNSGRLTLDSRDPVFVCWGDELTLLYNDACAPLLGEEHPAALGQSARRVWAVIQEGVVAQLDAALHGGRVGWDEERLF